MNGKLRIDSKHSTFFNGPSLGLVRTKTPKIRHFIPWTLVRATFLSFHHRISFNFNCHMSRNPLCVTRSPQKSWPIPLKCHYSLPFFFRIPREGFCTLPILNFLRFMLDLVINETLLSNFFLNLYNVTY